MSMWGTLGTAAGTAFGGPVGGALGGMLGGMFDGGEEEQATASPAMRETFRTMSPELEAEQRRQLAGLSGLNFEQFQGGLGGLQQEHEAARGMAGGIDPSRYQGSLDFANVGGLQALQQQYMQDPSAAIAAGDASRQLALQRQLAGLDDPSTAAGGWGGTRTNAELDRTRALSDVEFNKWATGQQLTAEQQAFDNAMAAQGASRTQAGLESQMPWYDVNQQAALGTNLQTAGNEPLKFDFETWKANQEGERGYAESQAKILASMPGAKPEFGHSTTYETDATNPGNYRNPAAFGAAGAAGATELARGVSGNSNPFAGLFGGNKGTTSTADSSGWSSNAYNGSSFTPTF